MKIIGTRMKYVGTAHRWAMGQEVLVIAVHRGGDDGQVLQDDAEIGELRSDDVVEWAPFIREADGTERPSWVTSDAKPDELTGL